MRKESYLSQPQAVEVHKVKAATDIIMRKNICAVEKEEEDGTKNEIYECDEVQHRFKDEVKKEDVESKFDYFWELAEGKSEIEASDEEAIKKGEPTTMERIEVIEDAIKELVEVIING